MKKFLMMILCSFTALLFLSGSSFAVQGNLLGIDETFAIAVDTTTSSTLSGGMIYEEGVLDFTGELTTAVLSLESNDFGLDTGFSLTAIKYRSTADDVGFIGISATPGYTTWDGSIYSSDFTESIDLTAVKNSPTFTLKFRSKVPAPTDIVSAGSAIRALSSFICDHVFGLPANIGESATAAESLGVSVSSWNPGFDSPYGVNLVPDEGYTQNMRNDFTANTVNIDNDDWSTKHHSLAVFYNNVHTNTLMTFAGG